jgi:hypothetical protein
MTSNPRPLPAAALENLTRDARKRVSEFHLQRPRHPLPIDARHWNASLVELDLGALVTNWFAAGDDHSAAISGPDAKTVSGASATFASATIALAETLDVLACYRIVPESADADATVAAVATALDSVITCARRLLRGENVELICPDAQRFRVAVPIDAPEIDVLEVVFGATRADLTDPTGAVTSARLIKALHPNQVEGLSRIADMMTALAEAPLVREQLLYASRVLLDDHSAHRLRTARRVKQTIHAAFAQDPDRTAGALRDLRSGTDRYAESSGRILHLQTRAYDTADARHRVTFELETYSKFVEGQLRPWAWTYRRMLAGGDLRPPELGRLVPMLAASSDPFLIDASSAMLVRVRNAFAHDDWTYDAGADAVLVDGDIWPVSLILSALVRAHSLVGGAEIGWAAARAESEALRTAMDAGDPQAAPLAIRRRAAQTWYGDNGVTVVDDELTADLYKVVLDDVDGRTFFPVLQATIQTSMHVEVGRYEVWITEGRRPLLSITRACVERSQPLWLAAVHAFPEMPTSTFLVLSAAARTDVETFAAAADASAVLAADDVVRALDELPRTGGMSPLTSRVAIAGWAAELAADELEALGAADDDTANLRQVSGWLAEVKDALLADTSGGHSRRLRNAYTRVTSWYRQQNPVDPGPTLTRARRPRRRPLGYGS